VTDSLGRTTVYHYDEHNLCIAETSPTGAVERHEYTEDMEPYRDIDPLGRATEYSYDDRGELCHP